MLVEVPQCTPVLPVEDTVRSKDGTEIGFVRMGSGPAVVFVHGSLATHGDWFRVAESLSDRFTCYLMDRRGHGLTGEGTSAYSIDREYEDIAAVLAAAGPGASLVGHSYGAACALGSALHASVARMVLYEPPLPVGGPVAGEALDDYCLAMESSSYEDALEIGMREFVGLPSAQIGAMRLSSIWPKLAAQVPSWPRELEAMDNLGTGVEHYAAISSSTLLLGGADSADHPFKDSIAALAQVMPCVRTASMKGQSHLALRRAPQLVTQLIESFLSK